MTIPMDKEKATLSESSSLSINVKLLDTLMNLAGELVLGRNQLLQGFKLSDIKTAELAGQRIDMITSEIQEAIMRTRMQPISQIVNTFSRLVQDESMQQGKSIQFISECNEVELDKTIIESIHDPLLGLIKKCIHYGIELPDQRKLSGKDKTGTILLKTFHDAGQVKILISDDGCGINPDTIVTTAIARGIVSDKTIKSMNEKQKLALVFNPEFSGSGSGADSTNNHLALNTISEIIASLGGVIELNSTTGKGTEILIKIPLTLAIIPGQIISLGDERYAIPQGNLLELIRISPDKVTEHIERVGNSEVVRLRGELLPLVDLASVLGVKKTYYDEKSNKTKICRRNNITDSRLNHSVPDSCDLPEDIPGNTIDICAEQEITDRRNHNGRVIHIAVVSAGAYKYGLIVDRLNDSEEIVVKPLGHHLKNASVFAGATILGGGNVGLILDISCIAKEADLSTTPDRPNDIKKRDDTKQSGNKKTSMILFQNKENEHFAAPLSMVKRLEKIKTESIELIGENKVIQYRGTALPLFELSQAGDFEPVPKNEKQEIIVFNITGREIGLMVKGPIDTREVIPDIDKMTLKQPVIKGSMIINNHTTLVVDMLKLVKIANPQWFN